MSSFLDTCIVSNNLPKVHAFPGMLKKNLKLKVTNVFEKVKELVEFPTHGYMQKSINQLQNS